MNAFDRIDSEDYGNGDMLKWHEREADRQRGPLPNDCKGGDQVGYMTHHEMMQSIKRQVEERKADVEANGCCKRKLPDGFCLHLCAMCPFVVQEM